MNRLIAAFSAMILLLTMSTTAYANTSARLLQLIDYVGVDYSGAVQDGEVINANEYAEMVEFGATIETLSSKLKDGPKTTLLRTQASDLRQLIVNKAPVVNIQSLTRQMRVYAVNSLGLKMTPDHRPDLVRGKTLYLETCAVCHGAAGQGNGPLAQDLDPQPTDFTDVTRYEHRSLYALFNTITYGVDGTAMGEFSTFSPEDRWNLTAYVGQIAASKALVQRGRDAWHKTPRTNAFDVKAYATLSPIEAAEKWQNGNELIAYIRSTPEVLFETKPSPLMIALSKIEESNAAYREGKNKRAYELALAAYLDGFELIEASLTAVDPALMQKAEREMMQYRQALQEGIAPEAVHERALSVQALLKLSQAKLAEKRGLTPEAAFITSFVILLREGLEALLVVAAISALLVKSGRRDAMPYLHFGWVFALVVGVATWFVSDRLLQISGATREVTEGVAALAASGMLLFVGYWLHSKTSATGWQTFIQKNLKSALSGRTLWGLAGLSFISVYREVFETILFYQALWAQTTSSSTMLWIMGGFFTGLFILVVIAWAIMRYSVQLPIGKFFGTTGILLVILSIVFAGKGVAALQEAGKITVTMLEFDAIKWIGIFPIKEGLILQGLIFAAALIVFTKDVFSRKKGDR